MKNILELGWSSKGIGWVDAQLLSTCLALPCRIYTHDKRLLSIAKELGIAWELTL